MFRVFNSAADQRAVPSAERGMLKAGHIYTGPLCQIGEEHIGGGAIQIAAIHRAPGKAIRYNSRGVRPLPRANRENHDEKDSPGSMRGRYGHKPFDSNTPSSSRENCRSLARNCYDHMEVGYSDYRVVFVE